MLYGATSKELLRLIKSKIGLILQSLVVLAIFIMPTFAQANNSTNMGMSTGNIGANTGSNNVVVNIMAKNIAFNMSTITAPAGAQVTVNFNSQDSGIQHNIAFYTDSSAATTIYKGPITTGSNMTTFTFTAPSTPGTYFFRCDVHPTQMIGQFAVTPITGSNTGSNTGLNTGSSGSSGSSSSGYSSSSSGGSYGSGY